MCCDNRTLHELVASDQQSVKISISLSLSLSLSLSFSLSLSLSAVTVRPWDTLWVHALVLNVERNLCRKSGMTHTVHRRSMETLGKVIQNTEYDSRTQRQTKYVNCSIVQPGALQRMRTGDTLTWVTVWQTKKVKDQSVVRAMLIAGKVRLSIPTEWTSTWTVSMTQRCLKQVRKRRL